ncbi:MAG: ABC transporter substrate-binding protein [Caldilineaceae bacterium]
MQSQRYRSPSFPPVASPTESLGRHLRWQVLIACVGLLALVSLLGYSTYSVATVLVPDKGGVYREGVVGNPRYLNPLVCDRNDVDEDLCALLFRGLTRIDRHGRVVPDLASDWSITDEKIYTFHLRENQFWHDGQPITADDALFTISILQNPDVVDVPNLSILWRTVQAEKVDDYTLRFILSEPFSPFLDYTAIGLLPKHIYGNVPASELAGSPLNGTPIGSGPLMVDELAADHIRLVPNPYDGEHRPYLSALEFYFYPDHPTLLTGYLNNEIDGISRVLPSEFPIAAAQEDLELFSAVQARYLSIVFNLTSANVPFFADQNVRQALYYGLNRTALIDEVTAGQGIVAHSPLLPENWAYNSDVPKYEYNPQQAEQLLNAAGWIDSNGDGVRDKDGRPLQFLLYSSDETLQQALIQRIADDWGKIGVRVVPTPVTFVSLVSDFLLPRKFEAALTSWDIPGDPDQYWLWHSTQAEEGGFNYAGWRNSEVDEILQQARSITDEGQRKALYDRFQIIFAEEVPSLLLYYPVYTYGVRKRVHNVQIGPLNRPAERFDNFADWYMVTRRVPANQAPTNAPPTPPSSITR